jgi:hypothetical protein
MRRRGLAPMVRLKGPSPTLKFREICDMTHRLVSGAAGCLTLMTLVLLPSAFAGTLPQQGTENAAADSVSQAIPRDPDGRPDLSGIWQSNVLDISNFTLEAEKRTSANRAANPGGGLPYRPEALERIRQLTEADDPMLRCLPRGPPRQTGSSSPLRIVQIPEEIIILYESDHRFRIIPADGRPHPDDWFPTYMGDSVAEWDGDTLVVDVIGFNDETWIHRLGTIHTEDMHVVERYHLSDANTLIYEATVEDPNVLTQPWSKTVTFNRRPQGDRIMESVCVDIQDADYFREVFDALDN